MDADVQVQADGKVRDGAVAELHPQPDGTITAEVRIPGPVLADS